MNKLKIKWIYKICKLQAQIKQQEMQIQHEFDMELKQMEVEAMKQKKNI